MHTETDKNVGPEETTPINTLLQMSRNRMDGIKNSFNAEKTAALHSITNNVGNPSTSRDIDASYSAGHRKHLQDIGPKYDPNLLMFRRMICSEDVTKNRLCLRDENTQISFDKTNIEAEEDEAFFENLKRRIGNDIKNKLFNTIEAPTPRKSSTPKKRKGAFNNECLNLMKKCRAQNLGRHDKSSSNLNNGIFSLDNERNSENNENIVAEQMLNISESFLLHKKTTSQISIHNIENVHYISSNCKKDDDDLRCPTPPGVKYVSDIPET